MGGHGRVLLTAVAMALICRVSASPISEGTSIDEIPLLLNALQSRELSASNANDMKELRELTSRLYGEALRSRMEYPDDPENQAVLPLPAKIMEMLQQQHDLQAKADKRASYMSLCHFKICNMGRKRTPWSMWPRT